MRRVHLWRGTLLLGLSALLMVGIGRLWLPAAAQDNRLADGVTVRGRIDAPDSEERWNFEAIAGDMLALSIEPQTAGFVPQLTVTDPKGRLLMRVSYPAAQQGVFRFTLGISQSGLHVVQVQGDAQTTGEYALGLTVIERAAQPGDGTLVYGRSVEGEISDAVYRTTWSFFGNAGDVVDVSMRATAGNLDPFLALLAPDGSQLASADGGGEGNNAALFAVRLPVRGTYTVVARRSGANLGAGGRTTGSFELLVSLRRAGTGEDSPTPIPLAVGTTVRGRLTRTAPLVRYGLETQGGNLALAVQVSEPAQGLHLAFYSAAGALLDSVTGVGDFACSVLAPSGGEVIVEVQPWGSLVAESVDFEISTVGLPARSTVPGRLVHGEIRQVAAGAGARSRWYAMAEVGDIVMLQFWPQVPAAQGTLQVVAPDGTTVLMRAVERELRQSLVLHQSGPYLILLDSGLAESGYSIRIDLLGKRWRAFAQRLPEQTALFLPAGGTTAELTPGSADVWLIDNPESVPWRFVLRRQSGTSELVMQIEAPDGEVIGTGLTEGLLGESSLYPRLSHSGRYRIRVFAVDGQGASYSLRAVPASGGTLEPGQRFKGVLSENDTAHNWWVEAPAGAVLSLDLESVVGSAAPALTVLDPDGLLLASSAQGDELTGLPLREGGRYRVLVTGSGAVSRQVYYLKAELSSVSIVSALESVPVPLPQERPMVQRVSIPALIIPAWQTDQLAQPASPLAVGVPVRGEIAQGHTAQSWELSVQAGQTFIFTAMPVVTDSPIAVAVIDPAGKVVAEEYGGDGKPAALTYSFPTAGEYRVSVGMRTARRYVLWAEPVDNLDPRAPRVIQGTLLALGATARATLRPETPQQTFVFWGQEGDTVFASVSAQIEIPLSLTLLDVTRQPVPRDDKLLDVTSGGVWKILTADGVYQLVVAVDGDSPLSAPLPFDVHLNVVSSVQAQVPSGGILGGSVTETLLPDRAAHWLFEGTAGQRVRATVTLLGDREGDVVILSLADSAGTVFAQRRAYFGQRELILGDITLPHTGIYQVIVEGAGGYSLKIEGQGVQQEASSTALDYGSTASGVLTPEDALDAWTWSGSRGDVIRVSARQTAGIPALLTMQVRARDGRALATAVAGPGRSAQIEHLELPLDGHYTLLVGSPSTEADVLSYTVSVQLEASTAYSIGRTIREGERWQGVLTIDDPVDTWLVEAADGDALSLSISPRDQRLSPAVALIATDWHLGGFSVTPAVLAEAQSVNGEPVELTYTFAVPGPYAVMITAPPRNYGAYEIAITQESSTALAAQRLRAGQLYQGELGEPVLSNFWAFQGQAGDTVTLVATTDSRSQVPLNMALTAPDGTIVAQADIQGEKSVRIADFPLRATGTYQVFVTVAAHVSSGTSTHYAFALQQVSETRPVIRPLQDRRPVFDVLDGDQPVQWWTFSGQANETARITARVTSGTLDPALAIYDMSGLLLAQTDDVEGLDAILTVTLPASGDFLVRVSRFAGPFGRTAGNYSLLLEKVYSVDDGQVEAALLFYGQHVEGTLDRQTDQARWAFWGAAGDTVSVTAQFPADDVPLLLTVSDPADTVLASGVRNGGSATIASLELPADGFYLVALRRPGDVRSPFSPFSLTLAITDWIEQIPVTPGVLIAGKPLTAQIGAGEAHFWQFSGIAGDAIACTALTDQLPPALEMSVYGPGGESVAQAQTVPGQAGALTTGNLVLQQSGVYTLVVRSRSQALPISYRLLLQPSVSQEIVPADIAPGEEVAGQLDDLNPSDAWRLSLRRDDQVYLQVQVLSGDLQPSLALLDPAGRPIALGVKEQTVPETRYVIGPLRAEKSGWYTVLVTRQGGNAGTTVGRYWLSVSQTPSLPEVVSAQEIVFGIPLWDNMAQHESRTYRFSAHAGDVVEVSVLRTEGEALPDLSLVGQDGRTFPVQVIATEGELAVPLFVVPRTGHYLIRLAADGPIGYGLYVTRLSLTAPAEGPVRQLGSGVRLIESIQGPGDATRWRFSGSQGEVMTFTVTAASAQFSPEAILYGPTGYLAKSADLLADDIVIGPVRLPETGEYILLVRSWQNAAGAGIGGYSVFMERAPQDVSGSSGGILPIGGQSVYGGLTASDPADSWLIEGSTSERLVIRIEISETLETVELALLAPDGTTLATHRAAQGDTIFEIARLPESGTYILRVSARPVADSPIEYSLAAAGGANIGLEDESHIQGIVVGQSGQGNLSPDQATETWVFYGQAGQVIEITGTTLSTVPRGSVALALADSSGELLQGSVQDGRLLVVGPLLLPRTGLYAVVVRAEPALFADIEVLPYEIRIGVPTPGATEMGTLQGEVTGQLDDTMPVHEWEVRPAFSGTYRLWGCSYSPGEELALIVLSQSRDTLGQGKPDESRDNCWSTTINLEGGQQHRVVITNPAFSGAVSYSLGVAPESYASAGLTIRPGEREVGRLDDEHFGDQWTIRGRGSQEVQATVEVTAGDLDLLVEVRSASAEVIASGIADGQGRVEVPFRLPRDGVAYLSVARKGRGGGSTSGEYILVLNSISEQK